MADLLAMSSGIIDGTLTDADTGPMNRINFQLSNIADGVSMVEAFSHCIVFETDDGLLGFDTSSARGGAQVVDAIRHWRDTPFNSLVYTHGHIDHVGGCGAFLADAEARGNPRPRIYGHENVAKRFDRYNFTNGYNTVINQRQFGQVARRGYDLGNDDLFLDAGAAEPDVTYSDGHNFSVGGLDVELKHARGETDDHTWSWIPKYKAICAGDFFIWCFPNAGNPQKVQRYPVEWAAAMRDMAAQDAELFLPAHGLPIAGKERIHRVLNDVADSLEFLVKETIDRMNAGLRLDEILGEVKIAREVLEKPWLRPTYDEPEFVIRNIWRMYGGWYDGNPSHLKPAPDASIAAELAALAGGAAVLAERARALAESDPRVACQLVEYAMQAAPEDLSIHALRAEVYQLRRDQESSLMAKGIYGSAANESRARLGQD